MWLNPAEEKVPLAQYIYESIVLSLPYRKVHGTGPDGEPLCDKEMLARFRIISQAEFDALETEQAQPGRYRRRRQTAAAPMQELEKGRKYKANKNNLSNPNINYIKMGHILNTKYPRRGAIREEPTIRQQPRRLRYAPTAVQRYSTTGFVPNAVSIAANSPSRKRRNNTPAASVQRSFPC